MAAGVAMPHADPGDYFDPSAAFFAQSSQQTVTVLPPTSTLIPLPSISQPQTGHFAFIGYPPGRCQTIAPTAATLAARLA
jgi:hypothetical protein